MCWIFAAAAASQGWRQKPRIEHPGREDHLVGEFVLLLCDVVGLQGRRCNLDGIGEDLLALLNLATFVGDGRLFVLDLRDGVTCLRRIEDDAGTELCICERLQRRNPTASTVRVSFFICLIPSSPLPRDALQRYGFTAVQRESPSGAARDGRPVACTVPRVLSS